jgi:hypothetical protein
LRAVFRRRRARFLKGAKRGAPGARTLSFALLLERFVAGSLQAHQCA